MDEDINNYNLDTFMEDPKERFKESIRKFNSDHGVLMTTADNLNEVNEDGEGS